MLHTELKIGDVVPQDGGRAPVHSIGTYAGHPRWHALMVLPQKEQVAEAWLSLRGVYAFHPVTSRERVVRGKRLRHESRYLPGFVFARFPGRPVRHRVMASPFISDTLRVQSGHWGVILPSDIRKLHAMRSVDDENQHRRHEAAKIRVGDRCRVLGDNFGAGQEIEVVEIRAGKARFRLRMFGADREIEADVDRLHKIE